MVKRCFGVKDFSYLIFGYGGLLDCLDGFVVVVLVVWLIGYFCYGVYSVGSGFMVW